MTYSPITVITFGKPDGFRDIHVGHLGGVILHADTFARHCRNMGREAWLISGTDGYGVSVYQHTFKRLGRVPSKEELLGYVMEHYKRQKRTLDAYQVSMEYYGLDAAPDETARIQMLCDTALRKLRDTGACTLRSELEYRDPLLKCPLGSRQLTKEMTERGVWYRSGVTGKLTEAEPVLNWFVSLEYFRPQIEASLKRYGRYAGDDFVRGFVQNTLRNPLPEYRLSSHQPWAIPVPGENNMKYQVWVASLLAPMAYVQQVAAQSGKMEHGTYEFVQFISEDTLFFYAIVQPVLWHLMWPDSPLPSLLCNRTRTFVDENGQPCFYTGDELLSRFTVEQLRTCLIGRGTGRTVIELTTREMNRLWKGYARAAVRMTDIPKDIEIGGAADKASAYERCMESLNFSKAADLADNYFHTAVPDAQTCIRMMRCITPDYAECLIHKHQGGGAT